MNDIYWLTRFDNLHTISTVILIASLISLVIFTIVYFANYDEDLESEKRYKKLGKRFALWSIIPAVIGAMGVIFIPTTKEAFAIWGIGGSIDYLRQNPTAKKLPDKCIDALDRWVDTLAADSTKVKK